jgi:hypothetical protein
MSNCLRGALCILLALVFSYADRPQQSRAATRKTLSVSIDERLKIDGSVSYTFSPSTLRTGIRTDLLRAPDGHSYDPTNPFGSTPRQFSTFEDLTNAIVGTWTLESFLRSDPVASLEKYEFTISPFYANDISFLRPTILFPANGSQVTSPVDISWNPPSDSYGIGGNVFTRRHWIADGLLRLSWDSPVSDDASFVFVTASGQNLPQFISNPIPSLSSPTYDLQLNLSYGKSIEIQFFPIEVAEPAAGFLICFGAALLGVTHGRRLQRTPGVA